VPSERDTGSPFGGPVAPWGSTSGAGAGAELAWDALTTDATSDPDGILSEFSVSNGNWSFTTTATTTNYTSGGLQERFARKTKRIRDIYPAWDPLTHGLWMQLTLDTLPSPPNGNWLVGLGIMNNPAGGYAAAAHLGCWLYKESGGGSWWNAHCTSGSPLSSVLVGSTPAAMQCMVIGTPGIGSGTSFLTEIKLWSDWPHQSARTVSWGGAIFNIPDDWYVQLFVGRAGPPGAVETWSGRVRTKLVPFGARSF